jgi:hypothetical protein
MKPNMKLHDRAVELCREHRRVEFALIEVLQQIEAAKFYRVFGCASLFKYAVDVLGMSESSAYSFITVARKAAAVPELQRTLRAQSLSVRTASRLASALTIDNAAELIEFAKTHNSRELDREIARRNPQAAHRVFIRDLSDDHVSLKISLRRQTLAKLKRAQDLMGGVELEEVLDRVLDQHLERKDPVKRAERAGSKPIRITIGRSKITAQEKHVVHARDQGRCTYVDAQGKRCESERWLHLHHMRPVSEGGSNSPENIRTLCASHHDLVHQLSFEVGKKPETLRAQSSFPKFRGRKIPPGSAEK